MVMPGQGAGRRGQSHWSSHWRLSEATAEVLRLRSSVPVSAGHAPRLLPRHAAQRGQPGVQLTVEVGGDLGEVLLDLVRGDLDGLHHLLAGLLGPLAAQRPLDLLLEGVPLLSGGGGGGAGDAGRVPPGVQGVPEAAHTEPLVLPGRVELSLGLPVAPD